MVKVCQSSGMSAAMVSSFFGDFGDHYRSNGSTGLQNSSKNGFGSQTDSPLKKSSLNSVYTAVQQNSNNVNVMNRRLVTTTASVPINLSHSAVHRMQSSPTVPVMQHKSPIGVHNTNTQPQLALTRGLTQANPCPQTNGMTTTTNNNNKEHKKLDRSYSEPAEKSGQQLVRLNSASATVAGPMSSRYKTELCRSFAEVGTCKYGDKCQFAHGGHELRVITRHPKFKTENCKSFHSTGFCPYGPRCHFIHNSEESKTNVLNNLSTKGSTSPTETSVSTNNMQNNRFGEQIMNGININGNNNYVTTYHSNGGTHPLRPKALSIGSYSLGSSGEISPPSSQSGSPTSLNSFFTEDPFNPFISPNGHQMGSNANNAFSFSPDFASLMPNSHQNGKSSSSAFSGSQTTLCSAFPLSANLNSDISEQSVMPTMFSNHFQTSPNKTYEQHLSDGSQGMATTPPPQVPKLTPVSSYPLAPDSPVDSIASDIDGLKLDNNNMSPPLPTCSSPLDVSKSLPRLPIFTRFANNGNNNDSE